MLYYTTPLLRFAKPPNSVALLIGPDGDAIVEVLGNNAMFYVATSVYSTNPRIPGLAYRDNPFPGLLSSVLNLSRRILEASFAARVSALFEEYYRTRTGQITFVKCEVSHTISEYTPEDGIHERAEYGLAALSWWPQELDGVRPLYVNLRRGGVNVQRPSAEPPEPEVPAKPVVPVDPVRSRFHLLSLES